MIRRFNAYVLWEITKLFLVALVAFTTVVMLAGVAKELVTQGLGPRAVLQLIPYILPISLQFALPATILFAVCSIYGRISADNEVLALMAAGVRPIRIISPTLIACTVLSLVAVWINDVAISWGKPGINRVIMHSIEQVVYGFLETQSVYNSAQGFSIHVHSIGDDGRELIGPTITIPQKGESIRISARTARLTMDPANDELVIEFNDSFLDGSKATLIHPGKYIHRVSLSEATRKGTSVGHPAEVPIRRISYEKREAYREIEHTQERIAARAALGLAVGRYDWLESNHTFRSLGQIQAGKDRVRRLRLEPWRRWAQGFSCFCFVWVGIPFAMWMKSADHWTSFGACFMPILLLYYPVFAVGLGNAKAGIWHPGAVWLGNAALLAVGTWWLLRLEKR